MKETKKIGIWMDHASAEIIDMNTEQNNRSIKSEFTYDTMRSAKQKSEHIMHNKERQMHESYYKKIASEILEYNHVLLFGPTDAKTELHNYLKKDMHFNDIKIDILSADNKITNNEKAAFVRNHFKK